MIIFGSASYPDVVCGTKDAVCPFLGEGGGSFS